MIFATPTTIAIPTYEGWRRILAAGRWPLGVALAVETEAKSGRPVELYVVNDPPYSGNLRAVAVAFGPEAPPGFAPSDGRWSLPLGGVNDALFDLLAEEYFP